MDAASEARHSEMLDQILVMVTKMTADLEATNAAFRAAFPPSTTDGISTSSSTTLAPATSSSTATVPLSVDPQDVSLVVPVADSDYSEHEAVFTTSTGSSPCYASPRSAPVFVSKYTTAELTDPPISVNGHSDDADVDHFSSLPDSLIRNIIARLPIKDAGRTAVLSHHWGPIWRAAPLFVGHADLAVNSNRFYSLVPRSLVGLLEQIRLQQQQGRARPLLVNNDLGVWLPASDVGGCEASVVFTKLVPVMPTMCSTLGLYRVVITLMPAHISSASPMSTSTTTSLASATITKQLLNTSHTSIDHRQGNKIPKPPWLLGTEVICSWSGRMQLISGFLLEASPWCSLFLLAVSRSWSEKTLLSDGFLLESSPWHIESEVLDYLLACSGAQLGMHLLNCLPELFVNTNGSSVYYKEWCHYVNILVCASLELLKGYNIFGAMSSELIMFHSSDQFISSSGVTREIVVVMECAGHSKILVLQCFISDIVLLYPGTLLCFVGRIEHHQCKCLRIAYIRKEAITLFLSNKYSILLELQACRLSRFRITMAGFCDYADDQEIDVLSYQTKIQGISSYLLYVFAFLGNRPALENQQALLKHLPVAMHVDMPAKGQKMLKGIVEQSRCVLYACSLGTANLKHVTSLAIFPTSNEAPFASHYNGIVSLISLEHPGILELSLRKDPLYWLYALLLNISSTPSERYGQTPAAQFSEAVTNYALNLALDCFACAKYLDGPDTILALEKVSEIFGLLWLASLEFTDQGKLLRQVQICATPVSNHDTNEASGRVGLLLEWFSYSLSANWREELNSYLSAHGLWNCCTNEFQASVCIWQSLLQPISHQNESSIEYIQVPRNPGDLNLIEVIAATAWGQAVFLGGKYVRILLEIVWVGLVKVYMGCSMTEGRPSPDIHWAEKEANHKYKRDTASARAGEEQPDGEDGGLRLEASCG